MIATGPSVNFGAVPVLGPSGFTQSVCNVDHAEQAYGAYQSFLRDPGPIVVGAAQGASCFGPAYEMAFILDADLRKKKLRKKVPIYFVTPEPYVGHMGLAGVGASRRLMEDEFAEHSIKPISNQALKEVQPGKVSLGRRAGGTVSLFDDHSALCRSRCGGGHCGTLQPERICEHRRLPGQSESIGTFIRSVCAWLSPRSSKPPFRPVLRRRASMIESMVSAAVHNIKADINDDPKRETATWNAICLADMGDTGMAFVALPQMAPRNVTWAKKGKWVHLAKIALEKYFLRKMKKGVSEPYYEKVILKALGITKLEQPV